MISREYYASDGLLYDIEATDEEHMHRQMSAIEDDLHSDDDWKKPSWYIKTRN